MRRSAVGLSAAAIAAALALGCVSCAPASANGGDSLYDLENLQPGQRALVKLPIEFDVRPESRLYLYGSRVYHVMLAISPGDSLCLNGVPVLPRRAANGWQTAGAKGERDWGFLAAVPYVVELTSRDTSLAAAGAAYLHEQAEVKRGVQRAYAGYRRVGVDADAAAREALAGLRGVDTHELIDWTRDIRLQDGFVYLWWKGLLGKFAFRLTEEEPAPRPSPPSELERRSLATHLYEMLGLNPGPCWHFVTYGADVTACGITNVAAVQSQIDAARDGKAVPEGPLSADAVLSILRQGE